MGSGVRPEAGFAGREARFEFLVSRPGRRGPVGEPMAPTLKGVSLLLPGGEHRLAERPAQGDEGQMDETERNA